MARPQEPFVVIHSGMGMKSDIADMAFHASRTMHDPRLLYEMEVLVQ